jgi:hypothetical protein
VTVHLYVDPMDAVLVDADPGGRIRLQGEEWREATLQERRAIIYSARNEIARLNELIEMLDTL